MKKVLFIVLLAVVGNYSNAQIGGGLKGLKNKADKAKSKVSKPVSTSSTVDSKEVIKARELEGEAQEQVDLLNSYFSNDNIKNIATKTIEETMYQFKSKLSTIRNYYAESSTKLSSLEAEYAKYKELASTEYRNREVAGETSTELKYISQQADNSREKGNSPSYMPKYAEYVELKEQYDSQAIKDATTDGYIANIEDYFNNHVPNVFSKELREYFQGQDYFKEDFWMYEPARAIEKIDYALDNDFVEKYKPLSKQSDWIDEITQMMKDHKVKLIDYKDNGDFAAFKEKKRREKADKVFPSKSVSNDASVISVVRKDHNVERSGTIQKIILITDWKVKKNDLGIPLEKYMMVEVISTIDGECYLNTGRVFRTYEGGGAYGKKKLSFYNTSYLMNCKNK